MDHRSSVDVVMLSKRWGTSIEVVQDTLRVTTQRGIRYFDKPFTRRFWTRQAQLGHQHLRTAVYSDTFFSDKTSVRGNTCAKISVTDIGHAKLYPMASKGNGCDKFDLYCSTVGIPNPIITDGAGEETGGE